MKLKILICLLSFTTLVLSSDSKCYYRPMNTKVKGYLCLLESDSLNSVTEINGDHLNGYNDDNVELLYSRNLTFSTFTSSFCDKFKNIKRIKMEVVDKVTNFGVHALKNCENLLEFRFTNGKLAELPADLFVDNVKLQEVSFASNKLTTLPENLFLNLGDLKILELYENNISFLPANIFKSLKSLERLSLSRNQLGQLNPSWFVNLHNLRELAMSYNGISDISKNTFINCNKLKLVWLSYNNITVIHADSFGSLEDFTDFYISDNKINAIDSKFIDKSSLRVIFMVGNLCSQTVKEYDSKDELKEKLKQCFENYQPRQE